MNRTMRTVVSAILILLGATFIVMWSVSGVAVRAIEDGTAVHGIAERALDDPAVMDAVADEISDAAIDALAQRGVDLDRLGMEAAVRLLVSEAVDSDLLRSAALDQVDAAEEQFVDALTDSLRAPAPLVIEVDMSDWLNSQVDGLPAIAAIVPTVQLPVVELTALDRDTFENVRTAYAIVHWSATWALWCGIALIVVGMFITTRFRWFLAKAALAVGVIAGAVWLAVRLWGVDVVAAHVPGAGGAVSALVSDIVTEAAAPALEARLGALAIGGLVAALALFMIGILTMPRDKA